MEKLRWWFELLDKVSAPAKRMRLALEQISPALGRGLRALSLFEGGLARVGRGALRVRNALRTMQARGAGLMQGSMGSFVGNLGARAVEVLLEAGIHATQTALSMVRLREDSLSAFKALTGSGEAASAVFDRILLIASKLGQSPKDAIEGVRTLMAAGLDASEAFTIMQGAMDLRAFNPNAELAPMLRNFTQMKALGRATFDELKEITTGAGISLGDVYASVGAQKGIDPKQIPKLLSQGKVRADEAIRGVLDSVLKITGKDKLGAYAEEKSTTSLSGLLDRLKAAPENFLLGLDPSVLEPFRAVLGSVVAFLDPASESGKKLANVVGLVVTAVAKIFAAMAGGQFTGLKAVYDLFAPLLERGDVFLFIVEKLADLFGFLATVAGAGLALIGVGLYGASLIIAATVHDLELLWNGIVSLFQWDGWSTLGEDIVNGIRDGLTRAWGALVETTKSLAASLPESVRKVLGIHSPSRVMMDLGMQTAEGFDRGLDGYNAQSAAPPFATRALASASVPDVRFEARGSRREPAPSPSQAAPSVDLHVTVHVESRDQEGRAMGQDIADVLERELGAHFERLALSLGA